MRLLLFVVDVVALVADGDAGLVRDLAAHRADFAKDSAAGEDVNVPAHRH